ncbi:plexin-B-like [Saccoglossus kowalevskii]
MTGDVYIGGVDYIYRLDKDLQLIYNITTKPDDGTDNYNKILSINYDDHNLVTCGSYHGYCQIRNLTDLSVLGTSDIYVAAATVDDSTVGFVAHGYDDKPMLYVGTSKLGNFYHGEKAVSGRQLEGTIFSTLSGGTVHETNVDIHTSYQQANSVIYKTGFSYGGFSYFLTVQSLGRSDNSYISRIVRVCQERNDFYYDSYTEITLKCNSSDDMSNNLLQAAHVMKPASDLAKSLSLEDGQHVLFAVFAKGETPQDLTPLQQSAVCLYKITDIEQAFSDAIFGCINQGGNDYKLDYISGSACPGIGGIGHTVKSFTNQPYFSLALLFRRSAQLVLCIDMSMEKILYPYTPFWNIPIHILKVHLRQRLSAVEYYNHYLQSSTVLPDITFDTVFHHVYVLSQYRITLSVTQLPDERDITPAYHCKFGGIFITPAVQSGNALTCDTPLIDIRPNIPSGQDSVAVQLSVKSMETTIEFVHTEFYFFNCSALDSCTECVSSNWACDWCIYENKCAHESSTCAEDDSSKIVVGENNIFGGSGRRGRHYCPYIEQQIDEVLVPVGLTVSLVVNAVNIPDLKDNPGYECILRGYGFEDSTSATRYNESTLMCDAKEYHYNADTKEFKVSLIVQWNANYIIDNIYGYIVTLYDCSVSLDCSECLSTVTSREQLQCGWCVSDNSCQIEQHCDYHWLPQDTTHNCGNPVIYEIWPSSGSFEGGTNILISGSNLGKTYSHIDNVHIGGRNCILVEERYTVSRSIECTTDSADIDMSGEISGENLNLASTRDDVTVYIGTEICNVTSIGNTILYCIPPESQPIGVDINGTATDNNLPEVMVVVGNLDFFIGYLSYMDQTSSPNIILIVVSLSIVAFLLLIVIVVVIVIYQCKHIDSERKINDLRKNVLNMDIKLSDIKDENTTDPRGSEEELQTPVSKIPNEGVPHICITSDYQTLQPQVTSEYQALETTLISREYESLQPCDVSQYQSLNKPAVTKQQETSNYEEIGRSTSDTQPMGSK